MELHPYLYFEGRCEEALAFYETTLGAKAEMTLRFRDNPEGATPGIPEDWDDKIMHTSIRIRDQLVMASDGCGPDARSHERPAR